MSVLVFLYFISVGILCLYGAHRSAMVWQLLRTPYRDPQLPTQTRFPRVCVQVPLYNEARVAERVIQAVARLSYPREALEIQILDDSTDETQTIVDDIVIALQQSNIPVRVIRRTNRSEFKAGALKRGMALSTAEFFAVFDADFIPPKDFLLKTVPYFEDSQTAFVQTRWGYSNRNESFLTRAQAILIDGHFLIEHAARAQKAYFNFNGTAGIWRRAAIEAAGGWQGDTITEDLDLSYRAFLNGWNAVYLRDLVCVSELPGSISAFKSQQYRWMKGAAQVARKLLPRILCSPWTVRQKLEAYFHLTAHFCYVLMVVTAVLLVPVALVRMDFFVFIGFWFELAIFFLTLCSLCIFYCYSQFVQERKIIVRDILSAVVLGTGIAAHCARASLAGLCMRTGEFVRTPKSGAYDTIGPILSQPVPERDYRSLLKHKKEVVMSVYLTLSIVYLSSKTLWLTIPFVLLILSGYAAVLYSAIHAENERS